MSTASDNRFTYLSPDDHQRWLWFTHVYCPCIVILAGCLRLRRKIHRLALDDAILLAAHLLYIVYWFLALYTLLNRLGKSEHLASPLDRAKASRLLFTSRIILVLILSFVHASVIALIRTVFSADYKSIPIWFRTVVIATVCEALLGTLLISVDCSSSKLLEAPYDLHKGTCSHNVARWIAYTTFESIFEPVLIVPVASVIWTVRVKAKTKLQVTGAFISRLIIWAPLWLHAVFYISFLKSRTSGAIDIVPTVVVEELWAAIALVSASLPLLVSDLGKLSTSGLSLDTLLQSEASQNSNKNTGRSHSESNNVNGNGNRNANAHSRPVDRSDSQSTVSAPDDDYQWDDELVLRPENDRGEHSATVLAQGAPRTQSLFSIGGRQKKGIIHEISFETTSELATAARV